MLPKGVPNATDTKLRTPVLPARVGPGSFALETEWNRNSSPCSNPITVASSDV